MLGQNFLFGFSWISLVLGLIGLASEGSVQNLSFGAFLWPFFYFGVRNWNFLGFRKFWFVVLGGCLWGYGIGSGPFFMGGH